MHWTRSSLVVSAVALVAGSAVVVPSALASTVASTAARCSSGAHTLSPPGAVVYPETGNGGYASQHTGVYLRYDAATNHFLHGTHVTLTERATQCLTDFSLDLQRRDVHGLRGGPDLHVDAVTVNGRPAAYEFVQPTYPGDPKGQDDPDPRAHEVGQQDPVGGPHHNPLPPACSPSLANGSRALRFSQDGDQCPATKLVITPAKAIPSGARFTVRVAYSGLPGEHHDGDGSREGWFRVPGGSAVYTEPIGSEAWMPLNNFPTAKPTYDFFITTVPGKTAIANGRLVGRQRHPAEPQFPDGSVTWHWHAPFRIANYLVLSMAGDYDLTSRVVDGRRYYEAQDQHIPASQRRANKLAMDQLPQATAFEEPFNGPFPWPTDGVVATNVPFREAEEMASMIVFVGAHVNTGTLYHENMHQWWGDNVSESEYRNTFFKEGLATLGGFLFQARTAVAAGGESTPAGGAAGAIGRDLAERFNRVYDRKKLFWIRAPSHAATYTLFNDPPTYTRPGATYIALRAILGPIRFNHTLEDIQSRYGGASITVPQLEAEFRQHLPIHSAACTTRLASFFTQWFDTDYPPGGGPGKRPLISGPGLDGQSFYVGACHR